MKAMTLVLSVILILGVAGSAMAWQGEGFKGGDCSAIGALLEDLSPELRQQVEDAFARFREKLEELRTDFHSKEAPRRDYRDDFRLEREDLREALLNELPPEVEEGLREWREENALNNFTGNMHRNQGFAGNRGGGGRHIHRDTNQQATGTSRI